MRRGLAMGMLTLAACAGPGGGEGPVGVAVEGAGAKPVIDYPIDFAPMERVPPVLGWARLAPHGDGYLAAWVESGTFSDQVEASFLGADGAPLRSSPFSFGPAESVLDAACAPAGECMVLWDAGPSEGLELTHLTEAGASKPFHVVKESFDGRVAYDAGAGAFVVAWQVDGVLARHFQDGAPIEAKPFQLAPAGATLESLACSPADGCLAAYSDAQAVAEGVIVTASGVAPPFELASSSPLVSLTWGGGVYFAVGPSGLGFASLRFGADGTALDAAPQPLMFSEPASYLAGVGFDGEAFTVLAFDRDGADVVSSGARVLPDGTPATPGGFELDGIGLPFALACGDQGCAAAVDFDADHELGLSAVPISKGAVGAPQAITEELGGQVIEAAFPFGDRAFVVWNENSVVRTRWFANDATAASPVVDAGIASSVEAGTADGDAGLLVTFHADGPRSTRVVSRGGVGPERPIEPPATTVPTHARFAWLDDTAFRGKLTLRRFDADGRALDAHPIPIVDPKKDTITQGAVARSGDLFVVVTFVDEPLQLAVTRVRDTGEVIDQVSLPHAFFDGFACSPTECLLAEEGNVGVFPRKAIDVRLVRFASHADTLAFDVSTLDTGSPDQVTWDGTRFLVSYTHDDDLRVARLDPDGPAIGARLGEGDIPRFFTPLADDRALLFGQVIGGSTKRPLELGNVSLVLVDGFPKGHPPSPGDPGSGIVAEGGGCAVASTGGASSTPDASAVGALLLAMAGLCSRARRRSELRVP